MAIPRGPCPSSRPPRRIVTGADRQPTLANVREGDDLGNDGGGVLSLRLARPDERDPGKPRRMTLRIEKNRLGEIGRKFVLDFYGSGLFFAEVDPAKARPTARRRPRRQPRRRRPLSGRRSRPCWLAGATSWTR